MSFLSICDMGFPCVIANSHAVRSLLCLRSESEYIMDIQSSGFALAVTLLAENTEHIQTQSWRVVQKWTQGYFFYGVTAPSGPGPPYYWGCTITLRHTTFGRITLEEWSARHRDLYLTTHNTRKRQASMSQRDSNPQTQKTNGRPTPYTEQPLV